MSLFILMFYVTWPGTTDINDQFCYNLASFNFGILMYINMQLSSQIKKNISFNQY